MMDFLVKHKLINPSQHWFLKPRACLTNVLCFFEEITKWVDEGSFHFHRGPSMYGITNQQSVYMLVVLICSRIE